MISSALHFVQINRNHCNNHTNKIPKNERVQFELYFNMCSPCFIIFIEITAVKITIIKHGNIPDSMMLKYGQGYVISRYQAKITKKKQSIHIYCHLAWGRSNQINVFHLNSSNKICDGTSCEMVEHKCES